MAFGTGPIGSCTRDGKWQFAMNLPAEMAEHATRQDPVTRSAAMSACENGGLGKLALGVLAERAEDTAGGRHRSRPCGQRLREMWHTAAGAELTGRDG